MTSQDDIAVLRAMRERGEITDDEYTELRRYVLRGAPLPPELRFAHPAPTAPTVPTTYPARPDRLDLDRRTHPDAGPGPARPAPARPESRSGQARPGQALVRRTPAADVARVATRARPVGPGTGSRPTRPGTRRGPVPGRRRRQVAAMVSGLLVLVLVGAGVWWFALRVSPVPPDAYAHRVCTTVGGWQAAMSGARERMVAELAGKDPPAAMRDTVVSFYQDAEERTARLSVAMAGIGSPNVVGGPHYAESLRQAVATVASAFHDDAEHAGQLDVTSRAVFDNQAQAEVATIDSRSQPVFDALAGRGLEPPLDLRAAFDSDPTCAAYTG
ncbi:MAG TPA: SHOCT domain-containing protein [Mycobacteriales bacterium]|nr:SHOCT domain-containing protein [Mycobacteriales bacterium]